MTLDFCHCLKPMMLSLLKLKLLVLTLFVYDDRLSYKEVEETYIIAVVRIYAERSIQQIKFRYNILNNNNTI